MMEFKLSTIGEIVQDGEGAKIILNRSYAPALEGLDGFSHIQVLWWFSEADSYHDRNSLTVCAPYKHSPPILGTFATRSPARPNPIALDCVQVTYVDPENATIGLAYIEAFDHSPVLDIKPYTPSLDRVENPTVPEWCGHWPKCYEASGFFDWEGEMTPATPCME